MEYLSYLAPQQLPEIILMDIFMPKLDGIATTLKIRSLYPSIQVIMLTAIEEDDKIFEAIKAGAKGYLLKDESTAKIVAAIEDVQAGGSQFTPSIARKALDFLEQYLVNAKFANNDLTRLSPREYEVLKYMTGGLIYQEIADKIGISLHTLKRHIANIFFKLEVSNRTQAVNKLKA